MFTTRLLVCALSLCASVGLSVPVAARSPASAPALWGPPVLCHPVAYEQGAIESLPFGKDRFDTMASLERAEVVDLMFEKIDARKDTFFHMETLRRGMIYLAWGDDPMEDEIERFVKTLETRVAAAKRAMEAASAESELQAHSELGLAAFDLAWTLEGLGELGLNPRTEALRDSSIETALAHRADDDALQLGAAILSFARNDQRALYEHLGRALRDVEDESSLMARNADNTIGPFVGVRGARALTALCEKKSKRA